MTNNEIISILSETVGYSNDGWFSGRIGETLSKDQWAELKTVPQKYFKDLYPKQRQQIESLPWISIKDRLPENSGEYLTLLDCNEHEVLKNRYTVQDENHPNAYWSLYNNTHVCYWMPIPLPNDNEVTYQKSVMDWHDGGQKM